MTRRSVARTITPARPGHGSGTTVHQVRAGGDRSMAPDPADERTTRRPLAS